MTREPRARKKPPADPGAARPAPAAWDSRWVSAALGATAFLVYLAQCPPVSGDKDSAEFTLVLALGGVAHPTGYPLFTLLGHAWTLAVHALGATWAYAANSWTALGGGVAMYALHRLGLALVGIVERGGGRGAATAPGLAAFLAALPVAWLALDPIWTYETTLAEVYAWHLAWALTAATVFVGDVRALDGPPGRPTPGLARRMATWGLLCGIGAAHHATFVFVAAPLSAILLWRLVVRREARPATLALVALAALLPLASDAWILVRGAHPGPGVWPTLRPGLAGAIEHVSARQYTRLFGGFAPSAAQVGMLASYVWPFLVAGGVFLVVALARARRPAERWATGGVLAAAALSTAFAFSYGAPDPSSYFLVPLALGLAALAPLLAGLAAGPRPARAGALVAAGALALGAIALWAPWNATAQARVQLYKGYSGYVRRMWNAIPFDSAFVFWEDDMYTTLLERQALDHEKPGVAVLLPIQLMSDAPRARFRARYGFDPWTPEFERLYGASRALHSDSLFALATGAVEARVNAQSPLPVIHFDPRSGEVRLLKKPLVPPPPPDR